MCSFLCLSIDEDAVLEIRSMAMERGGGGERERGREGEREREREDSNDK